MKILYMAFDPVPFPKGSATRIEATVRALVRGGGQVHLLTPRPPGGADVRLELDGLEHRPVAVGVGGDNFLDRVLYFRQVAAERVRSQSWDAIWFRSPWEGLPALESPACRIYEAHGFPSVELPSHYPQVLERDDLMDRLAFQEVALLRHCDLFVTPSRTGRSFLINRGADPGRIHVVPNSIDPQELVPPQAEPAPGPPWKLAYLGTLAPWQGLITLLEALGRLKGRVEVKLELAGTRKGRWMRQVRRVAQALRVRSAIEFRGPQDRAGVLELLQSCHFCAAPFPNDPRNSLQGCCPIKLLEYMAVARPILSTSLRPVREVLTHGSTAWLVRPDSPYALAEGIRWLTEHPEESTRMGLAAREEVAQSWNRELFDQRIAKLLGILRTRGTEPSTRDSGEGGPEPPAGE